MKMNTDNDTTLEQIKAALNSFETCRISVVLDSGEILNFHHATYGTVRYGDISTSKLIVDGVVRNSYTVPGVGTIVSSKGECGVGSFLHLIPC